MNTFLNAHIATLMPLFIGVLFVLLGLPLRKDKIKPNMFYGVRTARTLTDLDAWYRANRVAGMDMVILGTLSLGWAVVTLALPPAAQVTAMGAYAGCIGFGAMIMAIHSLLAVARTDTPGAPLAEPPKTLNDPRRIPPVR